MIREAPGLMPFKVHIPHIRSLSRAIQSTRLGHKTRSKAIMEAAFRTAAYLNNIGAALLEHGEYKSSGKALRHALQLLRQSLAEDSSTSASPFGEIVIDAARMLLQAKGNSLDPVIPVSSTLDSDDACAVADAILLCEDGAVYPMRIDSTVDFNPDVGIAIVLYNYGLTQRLSFMEFGSSQDLVKSRKMFKLAQQVVDSLKDSMSCCELPLLTVYLLSGLIFSSTADVLTLEGLHEDAALARGKAIEYVDLIYDLSSWIGGDIRVSPAA